MKNIYIFGLPQSQNQEPYEVIFIASNPINKDILSVVNGDIDVFKKDNPDFLEYYDADWYQHLYPNSPGNNPLEKYLNAMENINPEIPKWTQILPAIANSNLYLKLMETKNNNAFSAILVVIQYRNIELFQIMLQKVIEGIPGGLSDIELAGLNAILSECNFPEIS